MYKKINAILFLCIIVTSVVGQDLKGRIIDQKTGESVPFANVYLEGTTIGTTSDGTGFFVLDTKKKNTIPLIISTIGYQSKRIPEYQCNVEMIVELEPDTYDLGEVVIKAKRSTRQPKLNLFRESFLGKSKNAASCIIENEDALLLEENKETQTLYVKATEPLIIRNNALGYIITYNLREFRCSGDDVYYSGDHYFTEIEPADKTEEGRFKKNRLRTYKGSRLNLIRAIYNKSLKKNNFELYYTNYKAVNPKDIIQKELPNGDRMLYFLGNLVVYFKYEDEDEILYLTQKHTEKIATSYIIQKTGTRITKDGYFDPNSLVWSGEIAFNRIADLLPYDYVTK